MDKVNYNFYDFNFFEDLKFNFNLNTSTHPKISIIIPVYNQIIYTLNCLWSLKPELEDIETEIIIINDNSTDNTLETLQQISGITIIDNKENLGFLKNINLGINKSVGDYILLLNNDVVILPNLLKELTSTFSNFKNVGAVGCQSFHPTDIILEAGSIIYSNGITINLGRDQKPNNPSSQGIKIVDYCSGYCLLLKRFFPDGKLVQLDELFLPAYYEETDLCMTLKHKYNKLIYYNSYAQLIHFESISYNSKKSNKKEQLLDTNREKFLKKWNEYLKYYKAEPSTPFNSLLKNYNNAISVYLEDKITIQLEKKLIEDYTVGEHYYILVYKKKPDDLKIEKLRRNGIDVRYPYFNYKNKWITYFKILKNLKKQNFNLLTNSLYYRLLLHFI